TNLLFIIPSARLWRRKDVETTFDGGLMSAGLQQTGDLRREHRLESLRLDVILVQEDQPQDLAVLVRAQLALMSEVLELAQVELPLLSEETAIEAVAILGAPVGPQSRHPPKPERHRRPVAPVDLHIRLYALDELDQARQHGALPVDLAAGREPLLG